MKRFFRQLALGLLATGLLTVGCGKDQAAQPLQPTQQTQAPAHTKYFEQFLYKKSADAEGLLTSTAAPDSSKEYSNSCCAKDIIQFELELELHTAGNYVARVQEYETVKDGEHSFRVPNFERPVAKLEGKWKVEGNELVLENLGRGVAAKQGNVNVVAVTLKGTIGAYDLTKVKSALNLAFENRATAFEEQKAPVKKPKPE